MSPFRPPEPSLVRGGFAAATPPAPVPLGEWLDGLKQGLLLGAAALVLLVPPLKPGPPRPQAAPPSLAGLAPAPLPPLERRLDWGEHRPSPAARRLAGWVVDSADNGHRPFAILDKRRAQVLVFEPGGRLIGATPVLLGYAAGDDSVAGIGQRPIEQVRPEERTTPAGRFLAEPGRNALGEEVLWVDYEAAVSMHRVRATDPRERRLERLATPSPRDNRISFGCINLPPDFFEQVLWPNFRGRGGLVYVMPETRPLERVFPALAGGPGATVTSAGREAPLWRS